MAERLPTVSVVIPTRGRAALVRRLVKDVLTDEAATEVVVVVDGHDPSTADALADLADTDTRLRVVGGASLAKPTTHREGWVRNFGVRAATSEVVLALDDDLIPGPDLVSGHAAWHVREPALVVLGYMPVVASGRDSATVRLFRLGYEQACSKFEREPDSILRGMWGGNFSVRRSHWLGVLNRAELGGEYHEDRELGILLLQDGLRGVFDRSLAAQHQYSSSISLCAMNARRSAAAQMTIEHRYPEAARPRDESPSMERWSRLSRHARAWKACVGVLTVAARVSGYLRLDGIEFLLVRAVRSLGYAKGRREGEVSHKDLS